ncbi:MAG: hypothetical protein QW275_03255, partial [Candidatus Anstonellaceae archaeon]
NRLSKRQFDGFEALLSEYETAGGRLQGMMNNSTSAYLMAVEAEDSANDLLLQAMWKASSLDAGRVGSYNRLAEKKGEIDAQFKPPMTSEKYLELAQKYKEVAREIQAYLSSASLNPASKAFEIGNSFARSSVDSTVSLASSMAPISFKTRQSISVYLVPIALGVLDLSILAIALMGFVAVFHYFHGFFKSKLAISGWILAFVGFAFFLIVGSVGFYGIVLSNEKYVSFTEFFSSLKNSEKVAVIVHEEGVGRSTATAMENCAAQIEKQLALSGKKTIKYYIGDSNTCRYLVPQNATNSTYKEYTSTAQKCLDSLPDMPIFELRYSEKNQPPIFTTVAAKQAIIKGNEAYYGKKPMCDIANVLN